MKYPSLVSFIVSQTLQQQKKPFRASLKQNIQQLSFSRRFLFIESIKNDFSDSCRLRNWQKQLFCRHGPEDRVRCLVGIMGNLLHKQLPVRDLNQSRFSFLRLLFVLSTFPLSLHGVVALAYGLENTFSRSQRVLGFRIRQVPSVFSSNKFQVGTINYANVLLSWSGVCMHIVSKINRHCGACCPTKYLRSCDVIELVVLCLIGQSKYNEIK